MVKRCLPLEANPDVMTQFMWGLGVPEDVGFCDVYGLDDEMLAMVPQPVLAVLLLYPQDRKKESDASATAKSLLPVPGCTGGSLTNSMLPAQKEPNKKVYFTKQTVGNACGTIGIIHAIGNAVSKIKLVDGSYFHRFYKQTADMDPVQVSSPSCCFLEEDQEMEDAHSVAAAGGDTEAKDGVIEHYVCFSCVDDELYELDGGKPQPIHHGRSSPDSLLQDAARVIKARIAEYSESLNFNVMALSKMS